MKKFKADLHIHTVLSPCASLDASPRNIVKAALLNNLNIIGITDHNSTKHCALIKKLAAQQGIFVLCGVEITTKEEVHCLAFFKTENELLEMQHYLDEKLIVFPNDVGRFGYQVVVDENEYIIETEERLLINALDANIGAIEKKVHELGGLFIPAHINRLRNSIYSQLGVLPPSLEVEALGMTWNANEGEVREKYGVDKNITLIKNSDAHHPDNIGSGYSEFFMDEPSFDEIKLALLKQQGREVIPI